jgi:hypothetical protein
MLHLALAALWYAVAIVLLWALLVTMATPAQGTFLWAACSGPKYGQNLAVVTLHQMNLGPVSFDF